MGYLHLLPALPKAWKDGNVKGMRVRGGFELDMEWRDGKLARVEIRNISSEDGQCTIRYGGKTKALVIDRKTPTVLTEL